MKKILPTGSWLASMALFALALLMPFAVSAQVEEETVRINIEWIDDRPADSTDALLLTLFFHDGSFDLYDRGKPASQVIANLLKGSWAWDDMDTPAPGVLIHSLEPHNRWNQGVGLVLPGPEIYELHPVRHRFLTVFIPVQPSDDAFISNEDPYRIELFDLSQRFKGPLLIPFFGNDVMDAGICVNNETGVFILDTRNPSEIQCEPEQGVIGWHPGFNGSWRNPDALPQRILGASYGRDRTGTPYNLDVEAADFSRPGARIGHLVIRANANATMAMGSGSWYDPARSGEGFNVESFRRPGGRNEVLVYGYTYQPDGSGEPLWLVGGGTYDNLYDIKMYTVSGGKFASTDNPGSSERTLWGTMRVVTGPCDDFGLIRYYPLDPALFAGEYPLRRLSPRTEAADWLCRLDKPHPLLRAE